MHTRRCIELPGPSAVFRCRRPRGAAASAAACVAAAASGCSRRARSTAAAGAPEAEAGRQLSLLDAIEDGAESMRGSSELLFDLRSPRCLPGNVPAAAAPQPRTMHRVGEKKCACLHAASNQGSLQWMEYT